MSSFSTKTYQSQVLESIEANFKSCHELSSPSITFSATTERLWGRGLAYNPLPLSYAFVMSRNFAETTSALRDRLVAGAGFERREVSSNAKLNTLTIGTPLTEDETEVLKATVASTAAVAAIVEAAEVSRSTAIEFFQPLGLDRVIA